MQEGWDIPLQETVMVGAKELEEAESAPTLARKQEEANCGIKKGARIGRSGAYLLWPERYEIDSAAISGLIRGPFREFRSVLVWRKS